MTASSLRVPTAVAASALLLTLTACGGSSDATTAASTAASPSASPSPSPSPSPVELTEAAGTAAAAKINLQAADLPGFTASPADESEDEEEDALDKELSACVGATTVDPTVDVPSDDFSKGQEFPLLTAGSDVAFAADAETVSKDVLAYQSPKAIGCVTTYIAKELAAIGKEEGVTFGKPTVVRLTPAAPDSFGFSVTATATGGGQKIPFAFDLLGVGKQRTETSLVMFGIGTSIPAAQRDALFAELATRTDANAL